MKAVGFLTLFAFCQRKGKQLLFPHVVPCELLLCHRPWNSGVRRSGSEISDTTNSFPSSKLLISDVSAQQRKPANMSSVTALYTHWLIKCDQQAFTALWLQTSLHLLSSASDLLPQLIFMSMYYQNLGCLVINHLRWWLWIMYSHWWYQKMDASVGGACVNARFSIYSILLTSFRIFFFFF